MIIFTFFILTNLVIADNFFCDKIDTNNNLCIIDQDKSISVINYFNDTYSILFNNSKINCNQEQGNCSLKIQSDQNIYIQNSTFEIRNISLYSKNSISLKNSWISADISVQTGPGTSSPISDQGNAFVSIGSFQNQTKIDNSYGFNCPDFSLTVDEQFFGSGSSLPSFRAGGLVQINTQLLQIQDTNITSNGGPYSNFNCSNELFNAGTGGQIIIKFENITQDSSNIIIQAQGGNYCPGFIGGSGGRLSLSSANLNDLMNNKNLSYSVRGGVNVMSADIKPFQNGGSGSVCLVYNGEKNLFIESDELQIRQVQIQNSDFNQIQNVFIKNVQFGFKSNQNDFTFSCTNFSISKSIYNDFQGNQRNLNFKNFRLIDNSKFFAQVQMGITIGNQLYIDMESKFYIQNYVNIFSNQTIIHGVFQISENNNGRLKLQTQQLQIGPQSKFINISNIGIFSNETILLQGKIQNNNDRNCTWDQSMARDLFNLRNDEENNTFQISKSMQRLNIQSHGLSQDIFDLMDKLLDDHYTVFIVSMKDIILQEQSLIQGSRIGLFGSNIQIMENSSITAQALGCPANGGPGSGMYIIHGTQECAGTGGVYGGRGGFGIGLNYEESLSCRSFAYNIGLQRNSLIFGDQNNPAFEGSGGGVKYGSDDNSYGGGIILIGTIDVLLNNGFVSVEGGNSINEFCSINQASGSGSGGSLIINSKYLIGKGNFSTNGGDGYLNCAEGGGGRAKINLTHWYKQEQNYSQVDFTGYITSKPGSRIFDKKIIDQYGDKIQMFIGTSGSIFQQPCLNGHYQSAQLCKICPLGTYTTRVNYQGFCNPCLTLPKYGILKENSSIQCSHTCQSHSFSQNDQECIIFSEFYIVNYPLYQGIYLFWVLITLFIGYLLRYQQQKIVLEKSDNLLQNELSFHYHRIEIFGKNNLSDAWYLASEPPKKIQEYVISISMYREFVGKFNKLSKFSKFQCFFLRILCVCYYPYFIYLINKIKSKKVSKLRKYIQLNQYQIWNQQGLQLYDFSMKFTVDPLNTKAFVDIITKQEINLEFSQPASIHFAGEGNFRIPYYLNIHDAFFKDLHDRIPGINDYETMKGINKFIKYLNRDLRVINFSSDLDSFQNAVIQVIKLTKQYNEVLFSNLFVKFDLLCYQIPKLAYENRSYVVTEISDEKICQDFLKNIYWIKNTSQIYDINFGFLVFFMKSDIRINQNKKLNFGNDDLTASGWIHAIKDNQLKTKDEKNTNIYELRDNLIERYTNLNDSIFDEEKVSTVFRKDDIKIVSLLIYALQRFFNFFLNHQLYRGKNHFKILILLNFLIIFHQILFSVQFIYIKLMLYEDTLSIILPFPLAQTFSCFFGWLFIANQKYHILKAYLIFNFMGIFNIFLSIGLNIYIRNNSEFIWILKSVICLLQILIQKIGQIYLSKIIQ